MKPSLLYLAPVVPAATGNGLAMRAGTILEALTSHYAVSLRVVPLYPPVDAAVPTQFARLCASCTVSPPAPAARRGLGRTLAAVTTGLLWPDRSRRITRAITGEPFDVVHVFRMAMMPFARRCLSASSRLHLDLDDIESETHRRVAALCHANGDHARATVEAAEARRYDAIETGVFDACDRIYVCSERDRDVLRVRTRRDICVLPNAVRVPSGVEPRKEGNPFSFLFVGTLGYYPNEDAVRYLAAEILPRIRAAATTPFQFDIVGTGATDRLHRLTAAHPEFRLLGSVSDMASSYQEASAVVAPMRAGGGTRMKILEAFSYVRPVVSTSIGLEGIDAQDEEHVLIGDTPAAFAARCIRLMNDWSLGERLANRAYARLRQAYSFQALTKTLATFVH